MRSALKFLFVIACAFPIAGALSRLAVGPSAQNAAAPARASDRARQAAVLPKAATTRAPLPVPLPPPAPLPRSLASFDIERVIVERARLEVARGVRYDATYQALLAYPQGDVPDDVGACTDLVIRALRAADVDLQVLVHEDVIASPEHYPFSDVGDASIDHRRVATLYAYFEHNTIALGTDVNEPWTFRAGDIVFFAKHRCTLGWPCVAGHVALVSDRLGPRGMPLVLQNGGPQAAESDALDQPIMVGHFRLMTSVLALKKR